MEKPYRYESGESDNYLVAMADFGRWMSHVVDGNYFLRTAALDYEIDYASGVGRWRWLVRWAEVPAGSVKVQFPTRLAIADLPTPPSRV